MIRRYTDNEKNTIINYLKPFKQYCFYLYMDLIECGCDQEGLALWTYENQDGNLLIMYKYYDTLHLYGDSSCINNSIMQHINGIDIKLIYGPIEVINKIKQNNTIEVAGIEVNSIITIDQYTGVKLDTDETISLANTEDLEAVVSLMLKDELYNKVYSYEKLYSDLFRRQADGFGRVFILRKGNKIVASNATYAETEELAVIGGLITDPDMRGQGSGKKITSHTWDLVRREGKQGLAFIDMENEGSVKLHKKMGYMFIGENARLLLK